VFIYSVNDSSLWSLISFVFVGSTLAVIGSKYSSPNSNVEWDIKVKKH